MLVGVPSRSGEVALGPRVRVRRTFVKSGKGCVATYEASHVQLMTPPQALVVTTCFVQVGCHSLVSGAPWAGKVEWDGPHVGD